MAWSRPFLCFLYVVTLECWNTIYFRQLPGTHRKGGNTEMLMQEQNVDECICDADKVLHDTPQSSYKCYEIDNYHSTDGNNN
jgi:hypothetical protein